jgi:hypothetical protein
MDVKKTMLNGYKTYIAAIAAFLIALGAAMQAYVNGQPIDYQLLVSAFIALAMIFLRKGVAKTTSTPVNYYKL